MSTALPEVPVRAIISSVLIFVGFLFFQGTNARAEDVDAKKKDHLLTNIEIFGKTELPAIYILMPGASGDEDIKGSIINRDFSRDPFFMQNVDREEFEMKIVLRETNGDDKEKNKLLEAKR